MLTIGKRIRNARERAGLTQEEVAESVGVSRTAVARWEKGEIEPKVENLMAVAGKLNVSSDYLLGLDNEPVTRGLGLTAKAEQTLKEFILEIRNEQNRIKNQ